MIQPRSRPAAAASAPPGAAFTQGVAVAGDGERLYYEVRGDGTPLLLLNGLVSSLGHWPFLIDHYRRTHRVIAWDYRGHGGAPPPRDPASVSIEQFAEDAHAVHAAAAGDRAVVCGLSLGVQVALEQYRRHPDDVRALVLICGTWGHPLDRISPAPRLRAAAVRASRRFGDLGAVGRLLLRAVDSPLSPAIAFRIGGAHRQLCPPRVLDDLFRHVAALDPQVVGRSFASYFAHSAEDVLERIRVPTLIIAADHDELTPVARAERMHEAIPGSRLVVFPGHAHLVQVERPGAVHDAIDSFLALNGLGGRASAG